MFEEKKKEFINSYFRMFPTFFNENNEAMNEWIISLNGAFGPYKNKEIDWDKLKETVFSMITDPYKPLLPGKWKDKIADCVIKRSTADNEGNYWIATIFVKINGRVFEFGITPDQDKDKIIAFYENKGYEVYLKD